MLGTPNPPPGHISPHPHNRCQRLLLVKFGIDLGDGGGAVAQDDARYRMISCLVLTVFRQNFKTLRVANYKKNIIDNKGEVLINIFVVFVVYIPFV